MGIADDLVRAFNDGYARGKADAENYAQHCGDTDEPFTNADRIRMMTDEELAEFLDGEFWVLPNCKPDAPQDQETGMCLIASCHNCWLDWLKEEVNKQ